MSLSSGARLGPYEIISAIGAGGMGEVYRAKDTRLDRTVAIKVLPAHLAADPERRARFEREARAVSSLNHPHICALYDVGREGGVDFLVMEHLEGETLADRIRKGPLPLEQALRTGIEIAEALDKAHRHGVVHRDLKPANVMMTKSGAKLLDFGLAKATATGGADGLSAMPTAEKPLTEAGAILGTFQYMAPEQLEGGDADARTDIFTFGSVVYEMLTGTRAFVGKSQASLISAIMTSEPAPIATLQPLTPPTLDRLVRTCLAKDPDGRWQSAGDIARELKWIAGGPSLMNQPTTARSSRERRREGFAWALVVVLGLAGSAALLVPRRPLSPLTVVRFPLMLEAEVLNFARFSSISPDGSAIVYAINNRLYLRLLSDPVSRLISGSEKTASFITNPIFSPDGGSIAYFLGEGPLGGSIKRVSTGGGAGATIGEADLPSGMSWGADGILVGQIGKGILRLHPNGGKPELLVSLKSGEVAQDPQMLPGGEKILFTFGVGFQPTRAMADASYWDKARVVVQSLASGKRTILVDGGSAAQYLPTGHLLYALGGTLLAVPFELKTLAVSGEAVPVVDHVQRTDFLVGGMSAVRGGSAHFSVSDTGSLIFLPASPSSAPSLRALSTMDRAGSVARLKLPPAAFEAPRISPDGTRVAYDTDDGKEAIVWVYELSGANSPIRITFAGRNRFPVWSPDSRRVAFQSNREGEHGIAWQRADGSGAPEWLTKAEEGADHVPQSWSPTGNTLLFSVTGEGMAVWTLSMSDKTTTPFSDVHASMPFPPGADFSPDGRWVAYSYATGANANSAVFVQPFPATGAKYQISSEDDGHHPLWSPEGKELFYIPGPRRFVSVQVTTQPSFTFRRVNDRAIEEHESPFEAPVYERNYDMTPDGRRFIRVVGLSEPVRSATPSPAQLQIVLNWFEELKRLVPAKSQ